MSKGLSIKLSKNLDTVVHNQISVSINEISLKAIIVFENPRFKDKLSYICSAMYFMYLYTYLCFHEASKRNNGEKLNNAFLDFLGAQNHSKHGHMQIYK